MTVKRKRLLKITGLSMGILLLILVALVLWGRYEAKKACPGGHVDLKGRGEIIDYSEEKGVVRVRMQKPGSNDMEIVLLDACTGEIKSSLAIDGDALKLPK